MNFTQVLNQTSLRIDDTVVGPGPEVSRSYWDTKFGMEITSIADGVCELAREFSGNEFTLACTKSHIAVSEPGTWRRLAFVHPKQKYAHVSVTIADLDAWYRRFEKAGLPVSKVVRRLRVTLSPQDFANFEHKALLKELLQEAYRHYSTDGQ